MNAQNNRVEWSKMQAGEWHLFLARTEEGLCYVGTPGEAFETFMRQITKRFPQADVSENSPALEPYVQELLHYMDGKGRVFSLPVDVKGTPFQQKVWEALKKIPYGKTMSYSEIAAAINRPSATRAVGTAIGANPLLITVPCHRVIGKNGTMTGYRGGLDFKQFLLQLEKEKANIY